MLPSEDGGGGGGGGGVDGTWSWVDEGAMVKECGDFLGSCDVWCWIMVFLGLSDAGRRHDGMASLLSRVAGMHVCRCVCVCMVASITRLILRNLAWERCQVIHWMFFLQDRSDDEESDHTSDPYAAQPRGRVSPSPYTANTDRARQFNVSGLF